MEVEPWRMHAWREDVWTMVWRVVEGSAGLMADWLVCFASENRVMSRVVRWRIVRGRGRSRTP